MSIVHPFQPTSVPHELHVVRQKPSDVCCKCWEKSAVFLKMAGNTKTTKVWLSFSCHKFKTAFKQVCKTTFCLKDTWLMRTQLLTNFHGQRSVCKTCSIISLKENLLRTFNFNSVSRFYCCDVLYHVYKCGVVLLEHQWVKNQPKKYWEVVCGFILSQIPDAAVKFIHFVSPWNLHRTQSLSQSDPRKTSNKQGQNKQRIKQSNKQTNKQPNKMQDIIYQHPLTQGLKKNLRAGSLMVAFTYLSILAPLKGDSQKLIHPDMTKTCQKNSWENSSNGPTLRSVVSHMTLRGPYVPLNPGWLIGILIMVYEIIPI